MTLDRLEAELKKRKKEQQELFFQYQSLGGAIQQIEIFLEEERKEIKKQHGEKGRDAKK